MPTILCKSPNTYSRSQTKILPDSLHNQVQRRVLTARCVQITQQRGLSEADSALLISLIGFFNTGGRIVSGAITDHPRVDALFLTTLAIFSGDTSKYLKYLTI